VFAAKAPEEAHLTESFLTADAKLWEQKEYMTLCFVMPVISITLVNNRTYCVYLLC
jgi:hypothetical protein